MINCEKCGDEFPEILEENRPVPRYTHCDKCYRIELFGTFKEIHKILEDMITQNELSIKTNKENT